MVQDNKITPTLTLAQLYDAQKQYFDAFIIYNKLYQASPNEDLKDRRDAVEKKIFADMSLKYNDTTNIIFSAEDKEKFKIIPEQNHISFKQAMSEERLETTEFIEEEFEEDEYNLDTAEEIEMEYPDAPALPEIPKIEAGKVTYRPPSDDSEIINLTISELSQYIIKKVSKDKKLSDLTLKEIKEIKSLFRDLM